MRTPAPTATATPTAGALRHVLTHLLTPLLMCVGMGLAYLGAFAEPHPHHLPVAVVGSGHRAEAVAGAVAGQAGDKLDVRTVATRAEAEQLLRRQDVFGAYVPDGRAPELLVATAGSDTTAAVVQKVFTPVAAHQHAPLKVTDVVPPSQHDPTGQGIFFLLVALSIGSYASVAVIGGAGAALPLRLRALLAAATSLVVSLVGAALAGPVFHLVDHDLAGVWALGWLYSAGVLLVGTGLHTFLKRWTTLGVMVLFVMLNFTSSGGVFRPEMQNGLFAGLHDLWNGAAFVEGVRGLVYFGSHGLGGHVLTLTAWLAIGVAAIALAWAAERRGIKAQAAAEAEEEMEEAVAV
ncbi:hypothetical protein GCM10010218_41550 [Streptomyces mashuensis]|uniref:ABC transporter permease n=1 Tax=Streptomyces mashuensis TaxID=33904 RepID=A0A919B510_9ACTN|nr:hypothetical protein [Streptomyces mashuensis]GHF55694.1 hypothetical protein GCM10010218_41550 [Streptomyces mashuensis]